MNSPSDHLSDSQLATAIKASDREAFRVFYYRYHDAIFRFFVRRTQSPELANDMLQDIFMRVWEKRETLQPGKAIKSYIFRAAHNLVVDYLRRKGVQESYLQSHRETDSVEFTGGEFELRQKTLQAIAELPDPLRAVFMFSRFDGFKHREISEMLEISTRTVESRMGKALEILRKKLAPYLALSALVELF